MKNKPHMILFLLFIMVPALFYACSSPTPQIKPMALPMPTPAQEAYDRQVEEKLMAAYEVWKHTPHMMGGTTTNGVDCSGFVQAVFQDYFFMILPRTTGLQAKIGASVKRSLLRPGDLVFFKPSLFSSHVGIYLSGNRFLHAAKTSGVTISEITPAYWEKRFRTARRILPE